MGDVKIVAEFCYEMLPNSANFIIRIRYLFFLQSKCIDFHGRT